MKWGGRVADEKKRKKKIWDNVGGWSLALTDTKEQYERIEEDGEREIDNEKRLSH